MRGNTTTTYGSVTKSFHWLIAALIITMIPLGIIANGMADAAPLKPTLFSLHKTVGLFIFFVALARILWAITQPKPAHLHPDRKAETFLATLVHWLLYASLVLVPLSGWVHHAATTGFAPVWWPFGQGLPGVPVSDSVAHTAASLHIIFERVLAASILLHVAGALKHHFIDKDDTLARMTFGHTEPHPTPAPTPSPKAAPAMAVGIYVAALAIGAGLGLFKHDKIEAEALTQAISQWRVEDGTLAISVLQLGSNVEGSFADWTAAITFDESPDADGKHGDVRVTVSIPSLTLGSVTSQAMGPDFFNAEAFPTATYMADIFSDGEAYTAKGTLTIRDQSAPVELPFTLAIDGNTASMQGSTELNRMDYNIGTGTQPSEGSLAFPVALNVTLTATKN